MLAVGYLVGKVAKVAYLTGVEGCARCLIFIFVYTLSVAKISEVTGFSGVQGPVQCLIYVYSVLFCR